MAVVRARSAPPYALIAFVALWVVSTVLAVLFYVQWSGTDKDLVSAQRVNHDIATVSEQNTIGRDLLAESTDHNLTALRIASNELQSLKNLIAGSPTASFNAVTAKAQDAIKAANGTDSNLSQALVDVTGQRDKQTQALEDTRKKLEGVSAQIAAAESQNNTSIATLRSDNETLQQNLAKANDEVAKLAAARDAATAEGEKKLSDAIAAAEEARRKLVLENEQQKAELAKSQEQIGQLRQLVANSRRGTELNVGEPDGKIAHVNAAAGEVYINLTSKDHMVPGMTFTVYDPRTGVRFGTDEEALGNGSIEVIEPGETSSICRITRTTKGHAISEGDLISNVVYHNDKNRQFHFVVIGDFDLDGDGVATADERERLVRLISRWGGIIDDKVSPQTDYLVVGQRPAAPAIVEDDAATTGSAASQRAKEQDHYDDLIVEAKKLSIPVLNANRFLAMIGYYSTTIVRY